MIFSKGWASPKLKSRSVMEVKNGSIYKFNTLKISYRTSLIVTMTTDLSQNKYQLQTQPGHGKGICGVIWFWWGR
jgi:hypothetical protein